MINLAKISIILLHDQQCMEVCVFSFNLPLQPMVRWLESRSVDLRECGATLKVTKKSLLLFVELKNDFCLLWVDLIEKWMIFQRRLSLLHPLPRISSTIQILIIFSKGRFRGPTPFLVRGWNLIKILFHEVEQLWGVGAGITKTFWP